MNDYPPERIICDIVELLQDLKSQGYLAILTLHGNESIAVDLFDSKATYARWIEGERGCYAYSGFISSLSQTYHKQLADMYDALHDFKDLAEHHAAVEKMLCDREYIVENLVERAA